MTTVYSTGEVQPPARQTSTGTTVVLQLESLGEAATLPRLNAGHMNGGLGACDGV